MSNQNSRFDVCVVCAMAEEAQAFRKQLALSCDEPIKSAFDQRNYEYLYTTMHNARGEALTLRVSWLPRYGPLETGIHLDATIRQFQPRFVAMTGICAGDRRYTKLGDLVVAERAFFYDSGKFIKDETMQQQHLHDTLTAYPLTSILQVVRMFEGWETSLATLQRPLSKRQQREWLLYKLLQGERVRVDDLDMQTLETCAPAWRKIVHELQTGPDVLLTPDRMLRDRDQVNEMRFRDVFPFEDPRQITVHIAPMGSGHAVRADAPFDDIRVPVRGTVAIDMEGAAFYQTAGNFAGMRSLLVKGVCDYADSDKDDSYHSYAAEASALYLLSFIQEYVTAELMPATPIIQASEANNTGEKVAPAHPSGVSNSIGSINAGTVSVTQGEHVVIHNFYEPQSRNRVEKRKQ